MTFQFTVQQVFLYFHRCHHHYMVKIKTIIIVMTVLIITTAKMVIGDSLVVSTVLEPNIRE